MITINWNDTQLTTVFSFSEKKDFPPLKIPKKNGYYLFSRFACIHRKGKDFVLETPLISAILVFHDWRALALAQIFSSPKKPEEVQEEFSLLPQEIVSSLIQIFLSCKALSPCDNTGEEEEEPALKQWSFHDLFFHSRVRQGRHDNLFGKNYSFEEQINPLPAVKTERKGKTIPLFQPDLQALKEDDIPFSFVLEERRSIRKQGKQPIMVEELGEFLYRSARLRAKMPGKQQKYEFSNRPYPSGGACYDLEFYVVSNHSDGLSPGFYHYCPEKHELDFLSEKTSSVEKLLQDANRGIIGEGEPQILIILASRFQRVSWAYDSVSYSITLKNVGVCYQTMYLVATAMDLAPCALGFGDADLFSQIAGTDYFTETSVGEFILGSKEK